MNKDPHNKQIDSSNDPWSEIHINTTINTNPLAKDLSSTQRPNEIEARGINMLHRGIQQFRHSVSRLPSEAGILSALLVLMVISGLARPGFFDPSNLMQLARGTSFFGIIALGMVFMLAHGDVDLSVGSIYYVSSVIIALAMVSGLNPWLAAGLGVLCGCILGLINGSIAVLLRIPVLIVTLGTLSIYRGLGLVLSGTADVITPHAIRSSSFFKVVKFDFLDQIPVPVMIFFLLAVILQIVLNRTRFGIRLQAIGSNLNAARSLGVPVTKSRIFATGLVGITVGIVAALTIGFFGSANTMLGAGNELLVVSAVIIGGTPLTGGKGTVIGALIGALVISVISSSIVQLGVGSEWSAFVTGSVVILAVALDRTIQRRREERPIVR